MDPALLRIVLVVGLVAVATVAGALLQRRNGRTRVVGGSDSAAPSARLTLRDLGLDTQAEFGPVVVQVSAAVCSPCRAAARIWRSAAGQTRHVEVDVEEHVDLARRLEVWRTPTSFVFDADGALHARVDGVPTAAQARAALIIADSTTPARSAS